jgi:hypothetical protein
MIPIATHPDTTPHTPRSLRRRRGSALARVSCSARAVGTLLAATLALGSCGGAAHGHSGPSGSTAASTAATGDATSEPDAVVATVGRDAITRAMVEHVFAGLVKSEGPSAVAPAPPAFTACVKHLEAASASPPPNTSTLKSDCQAEYEKLQKQSLDTLISQQWVIGGAREEGVHVGRTALEHALLKAETGESPGQVERDLTNTGRTLADFARETRVALFGEGIRDVFLRRTRHPSQASIVSFYNEHRSEFSVPKRRDLQIVRAATEGAALNLKREIAAGRSFASVAKGLPASLQPIYSKDGFVREYEPRLYQEPPLDHAIFAAKPHLLSGPVGISLGYYVFKVTRTYPARQYSFTQAGPKIMRVLPKTLYKAAFAAYVRGWRQRWRARTDCQPGYVVPKCRQFKASGAHPAEPEDPYTLN